MGDCFPVGEVKGAEQGGAGGVRKGGGGVVECVADAEDVEVGVVLPDDGVGQGCLGEG